MAKTNVWLKVLCVFTVDFVNFSWLAFFTLSYVIMFLNKMCIIFFEIDFLQNVAPFTNGYSYLDMVLVLFVGVLPSFLKRVFREVRG